MSLEYLTLPHFLSCPEEEKLEMQVLRGLKDLTRSEVRPSLILSRPAMLSPKDRI